MCQLADSRCVLAVPMPVPVTVRPLAGFRADEWRFLALFARASILNPKVGNELGPLPGDPRQHRSCSPKPRPELAEEAFYCWKRAFFGESRQRVPMEDLGVLNDG